MVTFRKKWIDDDDIEFIDDNDSDNDEELKSPEKSELLRALETLQQFSLFTSDDGCTMSSLNALASKELCKNILLKR